MKKSLNWNVKNKGAPIMKNLLISLMIGSLLSACSFDSDPTKGTEYNFKNGSSANEEPTPFQESSLACLRFFNIDIQKNYNFDPRSPEEVQLTAYTTITGVESTLIIVENENNPSGLSLTESEEQGIYNLDWDTEDITFNNYSETFEIQVQHVITNKGSHQGFFEECQIANTRTIQLTAIREKNDIPVYFNKELIEDETSFDLNLEDHSKFELTLNEGAQESFLKINNLSLQQKQEFDDLSPFLDKEIYKSENREFPLTIDMKKLNEFYTHQGRTQIQLALSVLVFDGIEGRRLLLKFHYTLPYSVKKQSKTQIDSPSMSSTISNSRISGKDFSKNFVDLNNDSQGLKTLRDSSKLRVRDFSQTQKTESK